MKMTGMSELIKDQHQMLMKQMNHPSTHRANPRAFLRKHSENGEKQILSARNYMSGRNHKHYNVQTQNYKHTNMHMHSSGDEQDDG